MAKKLHRDTTEAEYEPDEAPEVVAVEPEPASRPAYSLAHRLLAHVPPLLVAYRVLVGVVGASIIGVGVLLLPLPGPGWVVIFAGVWVLAWEFPRAARVLAVLKRWAAVIIALLGRLRRGREHRAERRELRAAQRAANESDDAD